MADSATVPVVSVVLCSWNGAARIGAAIDALLDQHDAPPHELLIVDNASTDGTAEVVAARHARAGGRLRLLHEARPGVSHARNLGIREARGEIVAFTDDDVRVGPTWVADVAATLAAHPDTACVGGPVRPLWPSEVAAWLTPRHWAPLGVQDYGPHAFVVDASRPICLISANLAVRRTVLRRIGPFAPHVQRVGRGIGSTEDHEFLVRLWAAQLQGRYEPALRVEAEVDPARLTQRYHRAWHFGHGRHIARMRLDTMERSRRRVLGVPGHLYRQFLRDLAARGRAAVIGPRNPGDAFAHEVGLWFVAGYVRERWA